MLLEVYRLLVGSVIIREAGCWAVDDGGSIHILPFFLYLLDDDGPFYLRRMEGRERAISF